MAHKNGKLDENGRRMRRGNGTGSLYRKKVNGKATGPWFVRFSERTPDGQRKRVVWSTGTEDLDQARDVLSKEATKFGFTGDDGDHAAALDNVRANEERKRDELIKAQAKAEAERVAKEAADRQAAEEAERDRRAITISSAFAYYRESTKRPDSGAVTLAGYESQYETFASWMHEHHPDVDRLRDVTTDHADAFIKHLTQAKSPNTRNKYLIFLRTFWRVLRWEPDAQLTIDPWEGIRTLTTKADEVVHKELTTDQLTAIANTISTADVQGYKIRDVFKFGDKDIRDELRVLFAVGIYTGLRLGDCATLTWDTIDHARRTITTMPRKTARKYKRLVILPVHPVLAAVLDDYQSAHEPTAYILPTLADLYLNREKSMLTNRVQAILRAAGIQTTADGETGTKARTIAGFHSLRHTFTSIMLNAGVDSMHVEKMLGHSSDSMTARYFHQHAAALVQAVAKLPPLPQFAADTDRAAALLVDASKTPVEAEDADGSTTTSQSATDAPCGILDALRDVLATMTDAELTTAAELINGEIKRRSK